MGKTGVEKTWWGKHLGGIDPGRTDWARKDRWKNRWEKTGEGGEVSVTQKRSKLLTKIIFFFKNLYFVDSSGVLGPE